MYNPWPTVWPFVAMFVSASFFTSASYFSSFFFFIYGYLISVYYYSPDQFERFRNKISVGNLRKTRKKAKKTGKNMTAATPPAKFYEGKRWKLYDGRCHTICLLIYSLAKVPIKLESAWGLVQRRGIPSMGSLKLPSYSNTRCIYFLYIFVDL